MGRGGEVCFSHELVFCDPKRRRFQLTIYVWHSLSRMKLFMSWPHELESHRDPLSLPHVFRHSAVVNNRSLLSRFCANSTVKAVYFLPLHLIARSLATHILRHVFTCTTSWDIVFRSEKKSSNEAFELSLPRALDRWSGRWKRRKL